MLGCNFHDKESMAFVQWIELDTQLKGFHMKPHSNIQKGFDLRLLKYPVQLSRKLEYTGENEIPFKKRKHETWTKIWTS